jgi:hypothetical protein
MKEEHDQHLWNQFCRLGEMIGDGLHLESDGKWISKEYKRLSKILLKPSKEEKEFYKKAKQLKNESIDKQIAEKLLTQNCPQCDGKLKQARSGSKVVNCLECKGRFKYKSKK